MVRIGRVPILVAGCLLIIASTAMGATVLRFDLEQLTKRATVVVHGKVVSKKSRKDAKVGAVVTDLRLEVTEPLKGMRGNKFSFTVFGGVVGDRGSAISGAPTFELGEEVLVFLDRSNKFGMRSAVGLSQGKYTIREVDGKRLAFRDLEGLQYLDKASGRVEEAKAEQGRPFDELIARVRAICAAEKAGEGKKQ
jgi:hypothetical protein